MKNLDYLFISFFYILAIAAGIVGYTKQDPYYLIMVFIGAVAGTAILIDMIKNKKK